MRQLTSLDAQFLAIETSRTFGHVAGFAIYDPATAPDKGLSVDDVRGIISERLHMLPPFRWRLAEVPLGLDLPYWIEDPEFDLDFHIRESAVPPPGDDRQVAETVARLFARPLDRSRPLWELYVIQGIEGGRTGILTKFHHSAVDGMSGMEVQAVMLDPSPEGREIAPPEGDDLSVEPVPSDLEMLGRGLRGLPRQPLRALRSIPTALPNLTDLPGANAFPGVPTLSRGLARVREMLGGQEQDDGLLEVTTARPPRTSFNGRISAHRRFAFGSVSLDTVKAIKNELGITVNDVVVALCTTAVRDWLIARDELPEEPLVALIPVSVRTEAQRQDYGNRVATMIVPIPTDEPDPRSRLLRTHDLLSSAKDRHAALPADLLTDATSFIPPVLATRAARTTVEVLGRTRPPLNLVISNVPGPREPLYCAGARLQANFPVSAIADGVGLNITVVSYLDRMDFGIVADRDQIEDVWALMDGVAHGLEELAAALGVDPAPTEDEEQTAVAPEASSQQ